MSRSRARWPKRCRFCWHWTRRQIMNMVEGWIPCCPCCDDLFPGVR